MEEIVSAKTNLPKLSGAARGILLSAASGDLFLIGVHKPGDHHNPCLYRLAPSGWVNLNVAHEASDAARMLLKEMDVDIPSWYRSHNLLYRLFVEAKQRMERVVFEGVRH